MFRIYHEGRTISPFSVRRTVKSLFDCDIEIGANAISVGSVVIVRVTVVVHIAEIVRVTAIRRHRI